MLECHFKNTCKLFLSMGCSGLLLNEITVNQLPKCYQGLTLDMMPTPTISTGRNFESGAYRDKDDGKLDYEGFYSPIVMECFAEYMNRHRKQSDGKIRDSDNWQKGIPLDAYMKSMYRHFMDVWMEHRGWDSREGIIDGLCGLLFNVQGYLYEILKAQYEAEE